MSQETKRERDYRWPNRTPQLFKGFCQFHPLNKWPFHFYLTTSWHGEHGEPSKGLLSRQSWFNKLKSWNLVSTPWSWFCVLNTRRESTLPLQHESLPHLNTITLDLRPYREICPVSSPQPHSIFRPFYFFFLPLPQKRKFIPLAEKLSWHYLSRHQKSSFFSTQGLQKAPFPC